MCVYIYITHVSVSLQSEWIFSSYKISCMERKVVGKTEMYDKKPCMFPLLQISELLSHYNPSQHLKNVSQPKNFPSRKNVPERAGERITEWHKAKEVSFDGSLLVALF